MEDDRPKGPNFHIIDKLKDEMRKNARKFEEEIKLKQPTEPEASFLAQKDILK